MSKILYLSTLLLLTTSACVAREPRVNYQVLRDRQAEIADELAVIPAQPASHTAVKKDTHAKAEHAAHVSHDNSKEAMLTLHSLMQGNAHFAQGNGKHNLQNTKRRIELTSGQKPDAIILSCSDSRVPPEVVFDKGLGELFVVRTAGEVAESTALASIEYAIEHLHSKLVVVMGHSSCGAVKAALTTPQGKSAGSAHLDTLVGMIRPAIKHMHLAAGDKTFSEAVKANVNSVAASLIKRSEIISKALAAKEIMLVRGIYNLESGEVDFWF